MDPLALQIQVPRFEQPDMIGSLSKAMQIQHAQTGNQLALQQLNEGTERQSILSNYRAAERAGDPNAARHLAGLPDVQAQVQKNQAFQQQQNVEQTARAAVDVLSASDDRTVETYRQKLDELKSQGVLGTLRHSELSQISDPEKIRTMARGLIAQHKPELMLPHPTQVGSTLGMPEFGLYDPITQTTRNPPAAASPSAPGSASGSGAPGAAATPTEILRSGLKGDELLDALTKTVGSGFAASVKAIGNYDQPFPPPGSRDPMAHWKELFVRQYRPEYDTTGYAAKQKVMTGFSSGPEAEQIKSFNTVPMHMAGLYQAVTKLNNSDFVPGVTNRIGNAVGGQLSTKTQDALGDFESSKKAVAGEMAKVFRSAGMSVAEIDDWKDSFDNSTSSTKMYSAIRKGVELIEGRMGAVANQWRTTPGLHDKPFDKVSQPARAVFDLLRDAKGPLTKEQEAALGRASEEVRRSVTGQPGGRAMPGEKTDNGSLPQTQMAPPAGAQALVRQIQAGAKSVTLPSGKVLSAQEYTDAYNAKYGAPK